jgi:hypothetical protein
LVDIEAGQSLEAVARRINRRSLATGIEAGLSGNNLVLKSLDVGRDAKLRVEQLSTGGQSSISGVNAAQIPLFNTLSSPTSGSETLAGSLVSTGTRASLRYIGQPGGTVVDDARFLLLGADGTATISITADESLADVAVRINSRSSATGVTAVVEGDDLLLQSTAAGSRATVQVELVDSIGEVTTTGVNPTQIASLAASNVEPGEHVLSGSVTRTASQAVLSLRGTASGVVADGATFEVRGSDGTATISITAGESLADVAERVDALSGSTGVQATVSGNDLVFQSAGVGSAASVEVELLQVDHHITVSGVDVQQVSGFAVQNLQDGETDTLGGSVTQAAGIAQLTFNGNFLGLVGRNATFTLAGNSGSVSFSVTSLETLQSLVNRVNAATDATGVQATKQGNTVVFSSTGVGSDSFVNIDATSGQFPVSGGDGNGQAIGTDAVAVINGQTITADGNDFNYISAVGSYSFTVVQGFTGSLSAITIESQPGEFELVGGNGDGTAAGLDALAVVNGVERTGVGNRVTFTDASGQFEIEFQAGFTGAFDPITIRRDLVDFEIQGGNGAGRAVGADAVAVINGVRRVGSQNEFLIHGREGSYLLQFADGFSGDFDPITITASGGSLPAGAEQVRSLLRGADASVTFDGEQLSISRSSGTVSDAADFAIAQALSRRLRELAQNDADALPSILARINRHALASTFGIRSPIGTIENA